jgi:SAM-dependent methyltransferase
MSGEAFQLYGAHYDLLYRDKDYAAETDYIARTLRTARASTKRVLELGSGTGRHGRLLGSFGFDVVGVERSEAMLQAAMAADSAGLSLPPGGSFKCQAGDIRTVRLDELFDAVLALFHVVSYQTANEDVELTFATAARHLGPGGLFLFDVWHGPAVLTERPSVRVKRVEDDKTRLIRIAEPDLEIETNVVTVKYTVLAESKPDNQWTTFTEIHQMRYFFPVEIGLFAERAGFEVERAEEFLSGRAASASTWGVAYLLRKRT